MMRTVISNYWWGGSADNRHMHWQRWAELLTRLKPYGGMGFRDLKLFNLAMLGKQGWRLIEDPNLLCARVLEGRYYLPDGCMEEARKPYVASDSGRDGGVAEGALVKNWRWEFDEYMARPVDPKSFWRETDHHT